MQRWLREAGDKLDIEGRAKLLEALGKATDARDRALKSLKLDEATGDDYDPWEASRKIIIEAPDAAQESHGADSPPN
jgi:hypothetical protein